MELSEEEVQKLVKKMGELGILRITRDFMNPKSPNEIEVWIPGGENGHTQVMFTFEGY